MAVPALYTRQELLAEIHLKVMQPTLRTLQGKFDIPRSYKLTAPTRSQAIYDHDESRAPLYIKHLECGLRLPLHPFLCRVFTALGVSPMQMKPNSISTLVGFVVICHWLGVSPSLKVLGHLIGVKVHQKEPHFDFQVVGKFKIVVDPPESNKDWKEKFVWVTGDDSDLGCSNWPEIVREALTAGDLSKAEKEALDLIRAYTGSRKMEHLLDNSVLRVIGISFATPMARDEERAARLTLGLEEVAGVPTALPVGPQAGLSAAPAKRHHQDLVPEEATAAQCQTADIVATLAGQARLTAQVERKRKLRKVGSQGPRRVVGGGGRPKSSLWMRGPLLWMRGPLLEKRRKRPISRRQGSKSRPKQRARGLPLSLLSQLVVRGKRRPKRRRLLQRI